MSSETEKKAVEPVPYIVHESAEARHERREKRLLIAVIIAVFLMFATNIAWIIYESQFDTYSYQQDGSGLNNINTGEQGDIFGAKTDNSETP